MEYPQLLLPVLGNGLGNNNKQLGRVGELMVCFELEKLGYHTSLVEAEGYDIIVNILNKPIRLQVKSSGTTDKHSAKGGRPRYNFSTSVGKVKRKLTKGIPKAAVFPVPVCAVPKICLLYTSDAADE